MVSDEIANTPIHSGVRYVCLITVKRILCVLKHTVKGFLLVMGIIYVCIQVNLPYFMNTLLAYLNENKDNGTDNYNISTTMIVPTITYPPYVSTTEYESNSTSIATTMMSVSSSVAAPFQTTPSP
ncbi:hypothetical protein QAD02_001451 [Eretmocerus hayati]|uniref:Uncharacterized protein n=1 Tax=Eretmocerus hayati TaxID=131215 RepID=A0ACC2NGG9_9HYME|nr:hypothetical protein QAD02_001451 [Eretmocerus hayati]